MTYSCRVIYDSIILNYIRGDIMGIHIEDRDAFNICGYAVETTLEQNNNDISTLYSDFFKNGKENRILNISNSKKGYYGLSWYTKAHERYCYLLGLEVSSNNIPKDAILKEIPKTTFAVACYSKETDIINAWTDFYFNDIPKLGYEVNEKINLFFEYYPESVHGDFELWTPVVKANV